MNQPATDAGLLSGKQVAFTGRLASMTRQEAAELVRAYGGELVRYVSRQTLLIVVGQEGWPLQRDGRLTRKLQKARRLQRAGHPIHIVSEEELLASLGLEVRCRAVHRLYTTAQLSRILRVPRDRIRAWTRAGLVRPVETVHGLGYFDFNQVCGAKTLCDLARSGITLPRLRRSLRQLHSWMTGLDQPLTQLAVLERDGQLLVRLGEGHLADPTGQLHMDFCDEPKPAPLRVEPGARTAPEWFQLGCDHEEAGCLSAAAEAYRQAQLRDGQDPDVCFNLANVLYAMSQPEQAVEQLRQAVSIDRTFAEAWNNLGNILAELGQFGQSIAAYQKALELDPQYDDAHYNLADTLDQAGHVREARPHWQRYLQRDPSSPWADYARLRLRSTGQ